MEKAFIHGWIIHPNHGAEKVNSKKIITGVLILTVILGIVSCTVLQVHAQKSSVDWSPMFHHDLAHTGYSTSTGPLANQLLWSYPTDNSVEYSSPAVVNGVVFFGSHDHNVYALNAATGNKIWSYATNNSVNSCPVVVNGVVYIGSEDNNVYALDTASGDKIWSYKTGSEVESSPAVANGVVYVGSDDNNVYAFGSIVVTQASPLLPSSVPSSTTSPAHTPSSNQEILPIALLVAAFIAVIAVVIWAGLLLYFRKRKR